MTDQPHALADTLDRAWDDHRPGDDPLLDRLMALGTLDAEADRRVRARFLALTAPGHVAVAGPPTPAVGPALPRPHTSQPQRHRQRWLSWRFITGVAVGTALLLLLGIAIGTWLRSDLGPAGLRQELAALVGLDTLPPDSTVNGGVFVTPGNSPNGTLTVGAWLVTLAPGGTVDAPTNWAFLGKHVLDVRLVTGEITQIAHGVEQQLPGPGEKPVGTLPDEPDSWRNDGTMPSTLLIVAPTSLFLDLHVAGAETQAILTQSVSTADGYQVRVFVDELDNRGFNDRLRAGSPSLAQSSWPYTSLYIDQGFIENTRGERIGAGTTIDLTTTPAITLRAASDSSPNLRTFAIGVAPYAENPTLDQRVESIAPYWMNVPIPDNGAMTVAFRTIAIPIGGTYSLKSSLGIAYGLVQGAAKLSSTRFQSTTIADVGATVMQGPDTVLTFETLGSQEVRLVQVVSGPEEAVQQALSTGLPVGALASDLHLLRPHLAGTEGNIGLRVATTAGGGGRQGQNTLSIIKPFNETIEISRTEGTARIERSDGTAIDDLPLGEMTTLGVGDTYIGDPGSGWYLTARSMHAVWLEFTLTGMTDDQSLSTPGALPETSALDGGVVVGDASLCTVAPLPPSRIDAMIATPASGTSPLSRSMRDRQGTPASSAIAEDVLSMIQSFVDCQANGDYARIGTFYTDRFLQGSPEYAALIRDGYQSGGDGGARSTFAVVEDIVEFPDGRVGLRMVLDGEYAYLTLVKQDGAWKIDVWDDRIDPATPATSG